MLGPAMRDLSALSLCALVMIGCSGKRVTAGPTVVLSSPVMLDAGPPVVEVSEGCELCVGAPRPLTVSPGLRALAPQYFHPGSRDGFNDLIPKSDRYWWYDPADLDRPVLPPAGMNMIWRSTASFWFGMGKSGLSVALRSGGASKSVSPVVDGRLLDAVEGASGIGWVITVPIQDPTQPASETRLQLVRVLDDLRAESVGSWQVRRDRWDRSVAVTLNGDVAVAWADPDSLGIALRLVWVVDGIAQAPQVIDRVALPADVADLSSRTTVDLAMTAHGQDGVAVGWHPLVPAQGDRVDVGSASEPPAHGVSAQTRILMVSPRDATMAPDRYRSIAVPLGATTGIGPWPLARTGMSAASLQGRAMFAWNEWEGSQSRVVWASPQHPRRDIVGGSFRILFRGRGNQGLDLLLLNSLGELTQAPIGCCPAGLGR